MTVTLDYKALKIMSQMKKWKVYDRGGWTQSAVCSVKLYR